jgi:hypothetical protein
MLESHRHPFPPQVTMRSDSGSTGSNAGRERPSQSLTSLPRRTLRFEEVALNELEPGSYAYRVTLAGGVKDRLFVGEGGSVAVGATGFEGAARAALRAVEAYADVPLTLHSCRKTESAGRELMLVVLSVAGNEFQDLAGAVVVRGDESKAAALAVLDATNRWLEVRGRTGALRA